MNKDLLEIIVKADKKVIIETLARIGIADKNRNLLYPSCYLIEKDNKTYIAHFKQCFLLEGNEGAYDNISEDDINRRNAIAFCLKSWKLIDVDDDKIEPHTKFIFVLPHKLKHEWTICHKYTQKLK